MKTLCNSISQKISTILWINGYKHDSVEMEMKFAMFSVWLALQISIPLLGCTIWSGRIRKFEWVNSIKIHTQLLAQKLCINWSDSSKKDANVFRIKIEWKCNSLHIRTICQMKIWQWNAMAYFWRMTFVVLLALFATISFLSGDGVRVAVSCHFLKIIYEK